MLEPERRAEPNPRVRLGDNQPPSPIEILVAAQREAIEPRAERLAYILERASAKTVVDRETAGQAGDIIKVAGEFIEIVENDRLERTRPYREAADAAKGVADEFLQPLRDAVGELHARLNAWDAEEQARITAQRTEQEAFFAAQEKHESVTDPCPAPPPPKMRPAKRRRITGDLGARVDQVEVLEYRVVDVRQVPDMILNSKTVHDAIIQVAKSMRRHMPTIAGIETSSDTTNRVR